MPQLEHIDTIERDLWKAADDLRANSNYASNQYFLPVMGLVFLRHAYSRYLAVKDEVEAGLPTRGGKKRSPAKEDFSQKNAILLRRKAQFDYLIELPDSEDRAKAIISAMESIERDYADLRGVLPKEEYRKLNNDILGNLLRCLNPAALQQTNGDVFGRIYEYFLTKFARDKAHDGGEFFTPVSLVSLIAHILDPKRGTVLDPACGSGGMFVQSARTVEEHGKKSSEQLTFRGLEKNPDTIRLAKMNLAVHGLEGDIREAITYHEDPHQQTGEAHYVMANPPFNVKEIDADKIRNDSRLPFGLPGVNPKGKVKNGNYVWISYFYSYLNKKGRAGFVMSSQASSASDEEAKVRRQLVETGDVELMVAIRSHFFYTRTLPCELWFLNRNKSEKHRDKVLMIDARKIYRRVNRTIYDFSPEQEKNILAIVWLYRGETQRYLDLVSNYCSRTLDEGAACFSTEPKSKDATSPLPDFISALVALQDILSLFLNTLDATAAPAETGKELKDALSKLKADMGAFQQQAAKQQTAWKKQYASKPSISNGALKKAVDRLAPLAETSRSLIKQADLTHKTAERLVKTCEKECNTKTSGKWNSREISRTLKTVDKMHQAATKQLKQVRCFWKQAHWLTTRFPEAKLRDVEGLVKLVDHTEIADNDWSLTPGRYVGIAPEEEDEDFDFATTMRDIHTELEALNVEACKLAKQIQKNFEGLGI